MLMVEQGQATFGQAMATSQAGEWKEAIDSEAASIEENGPYEDISELPPGKKEIPTKIIRTHKLDTTGKPIRYTARLVAKGFRQTLGVDYHETIITGCAYPQRQNRSNDRRSSRPRG